MLLAAVSELVRETIKTLETSVKSFLAHACTGFERSKLLRIQRVWLGQLGVFRIIVAAVSNYFLSGWNALFEVALVHGKIRRAGTDWSFEPNKFGIEKAQGKFVH